MTKLSTPDYWLRILAEQSDQIYWVMGMNPPQMLYISSAFERIWKMPVSSVMGNPQLWIDTIISEDQPRVLTLFETLLSGEVQRYDINYRIIDGHGSMRWIRDSGLVVHDPVSNGRLAMGVSEDSTELHRSEHSLRQRIEWFDLINEQAPIVMWTTDRKLRFTSSAGLGLQKLGLTPNQMVGVSLFEYFQTQDHELGPIKYHLMALQGEEQVYEYELQGVQRIYHTRLRPFRDTNGEIIGVVGIAMDITEIKETQEQIFESERTFRSIVDFNPDFVSILVDGKVQYVNKSFLQETGYSAEEVLGVTAFELLEPEGREHAARRLVEIAAGDTPRPSEYQLLRRNGSTLPVEIMAQPITYQGKSAIFGLIRNISRHKQIENEIRQHGEELERLVEERTAQIRDLEQQRAQVEKLAATGRMAARVAHEINNPLAGIKNAFRLVRDAVTPEHPHYRYVELIDREIDRIANIVQLMYRLYRPGQLQWSLFDLGSCIRDVASLIDLTAGKRGVRIEINEDGCPRVRVPVGHIEQILFNLIQNAIEASPDRGVVTITAGKGLRGAVVSVSDRGPGVPESLRPLIFEPFFTSKTEGDPTGLGLGLSVTRSLIESIGGSIEYSDRPGGGATFTVVLPSED